MPNDNLLYWDSSVFIDLIEKTTNRYAILEAIIQDAEQGKARIITSALTLAEV
jgi:predicted nucleic acid-binding protein